MGFNVSYVESVLVFILLDKDCMGGDGCLDNLEGAGGHCFKDCISKERGGGEHTDPFVVDIAAGGGFEGVKGVGACICCGNDVGCGLSAFGFGCYGSTGIKSNGLGIRAYPKEGCYCVGGLEHCFVVVFQIVKNGDLFLVVSDENEVVVLAQVLHLGVHGSVVSHCFQVFLHVAVADRIQWR